MSPEQLEKLRDEYTDQYVVINSQRPELARFEGMTGRVWSINCNGRALVEFEESAGRGRYDVELDYVKVVDEPKPKPADAKDQPQEKLSPLELARLEKDGKTATHTRSRS